MHPYTCVSLQHARAFVRKTWTWGKLLKKIVGHVDTVWETKQVYTRITLMSKYVTIPGINRRNSLKLNLRTSVSSGITI